MVLKEVILVLLRRAILLFVLLPESGCMNISNHSSPVGSVYAYSGTVDDALLIATPFQDTYGPEGSIARAYATLLLPFTILDMPLEIVADTITLPYDIFQ